MDYQALITLAQNRTQWFVAGDHTNNFLEYLSTNQRDKTITLRHIIRPRHITITLRNLAANKQLNTIIILLSTETIKKKYMPFIYKRVALLRRLIQDQGRTDVSIIIVADIAPVHQLHYDIQLYQPLL